MTPSLRNARWYADVRAEARAAGVHASMVDAMDSQIGQSIDDLVARGLLTSQDATAVRWQLGMEDAPPHVDEAVRRFIVASWQLNTDPAAQLDPFELYAKGLEQDLAAARRDYARQLNPTPRKDYEDPAAPAKTGGVLIAVGIILGLAILAGRRRRR